MKPKINYGWWWDIKCRCCVGNSHSYAKKCYRRAERRYNKGKEKWNTETNLIETD